ncbi:MAG: hypothetical protein V4616_00165, partial [Bacteroidota bacterium]
FTFTKPHSLLNFVETILDRQGSSSTLRTIFRESRFNTPAARTKLEALSKCKTEYSYRFDGYPESRYMYRSTWDLLTIASARCQTLGELKIASVGLLPNSEHHELFETLNYFDTIYSDLVWNDNLNKLAGYCTQLSDYAQNRSIDLLFQKLSTFYGSSWDPDVPFRVCLYPIPGKRGNSTATPKGNIVTCGVLLDDYNYANTLGVVLHEVCHLLYREQSPELQNRFEQWFLTAKPSSRLLAYQLVDEALATALGNGWIYESIAGKSDTADWYNDPYIDKFAKNAYPVIREYVSHGGTIDPALVNSLCAVYDRIFPGADHDLNTLFSNLRIVADLNDTVVPVVFPALFRNFRVSGAGLSSPLDEKNLDDLSTHLATRVILITSDNKAAWEFVKKKVKDLQGLKTGDMNRNYFQLLQSTEGVSYVLVNLQSPAFLPELFEQMKLKHRIDAGNAVVYLGRE